jgi:hypothetical protein
MLDLPEEIRSIVGEIEALQETETYLAFDLADVERILAYEDAVFIQQAYEDNLISGKNQAERDRQELAMLENNRHRDEILEEIDALRYYFQMIKNRRVALELEASLIKAWLYSKGGPR